MHSRDHFYIQHLCELIMHCKRTSLTKESVSEPFCKATVNIQLFIYILHKEMSMCCVFQSSRLVHPALSRPSAPPHSVSEEHSPGWLCETINRKTGRWREEHWLRCQKMLASHLTVVSLHFPTFKMMEFLKIGRNFGFSSETKNLGVNTSPYKKKNVGQTECPWFILDILENWGDKENQHPKIWKDRQMQEITTGMYLEQKLPKP